jgi:hypothetical protein
MPMNRASGAHICEKESGTRLMALESPVVSMVQEAAPGAVVFERVIGVASTRIAAMNRTPLAPH